MGLQHRQYALPQNIISKNLMFIVEGIPSHVVDSFRGTGHLVTKSLSCRIVLSKDDIKGTFKTFFKVMNHRKHLMQFQGTIDTFTFIYHLHKVCPLYVDGGLLWSLYNHDISNDNTLKQNLIAIYRALAKIPYRENHTILILSQLAMYLQSHQYDMCIHWIQNLLKFVF